MRRLRSAVVVVLISAAPLLAVGSVRPVAPWVAPNSRCFELRTYTAAPDKLEALHARFRDHTMKLFARHGMTVVGFWAPSDKNQGADHTLVYLLAFPDREAREKSWDEFRKDPEWIAARDASEKNGKLTEKIDSVVLAATDYSPLK
jgi:hypothetical protein